MHATKRSALAPDGVPSRELTDSSARAMTSQTTLPPQFRSSSKRLLGFIVFAALAAVVGAVFAGRFSGEADKVQPPTVATPPASALVAVPPAVTAEPVPSTRPAADSSADIADVQASASAVASAHTPPASTKPGGHKPPVRGGGGKPPVGESSSGAEAPPATAATPPPATTPPPPTTQTTPHKPPPVLDRTSPFGN